MSAERTFWYKGLRVEVWAKSFRWTGLPFVVFLGEPPDDTKIKAMIDSARRPLYRKHPVRSYTQDHEEPSRPERGFWRQLFFGPWKP